MDVVATQASRSRDFIDERDRDAKGCSTISLRCHQRHCVLAAFMEFSLRYYHAYATTMVRPCHVVQRRSHYALNRFYRYLPRPCTFVVGSQCVFVTSSDSSINTRFSFSSHQSDTHFCFNNDTVNMDSVQNPELLLPICLLQGQQALLK